MTSFLRNAISIGVLLTTATASHAVLTGSAGTVITISGLRDSSTTAAPSEDAAAGRAAWENFVTVTGSASFTGFNTGTGDFETSGPDTGKLSLASIGAKLSCSEDPADTLVPMSCEIKQSPNAGRYDNTGDANARYLQSKFSVDGDIVVEFASAIAAFSFYMTDANDFVSENTAASDKKIELTDTNGNKTLITVATGSSREDGNLQFFGFYDDGPTRYTSIRFLNSNAGDAFGLDELTVGRVTGCSTNCNPVPEPGTLALLGLALAGVAGTKRRAKA
jgi:hypothetical protein